MKDPLTKREKDRLFRNFRAEWEKRYTDALRCGALPEKEPHDHTVGRYCLIIAANNFRPLLPEHQRELANLRHFV